MIVSGALLCACNAEVMEPAPEPTDQQPTTTTPQNGKSDTIGEPTQNIGLCAREAPATPYEPVPGPTRAQPDGPDVLPTRVGVPLLLDYATPTSVTGDFGQGGCDRHYFVFTLDRPSHLTIHGNVAEIGDATLGLCVVRPRFVRIDTSWFDRIWQKEMSAHPGPACGPFVQTEEGIEPAWDMDMDFQPGTYEMTIEPLTVDDVQYDLEFDFTPLSDAICGNGELDPGEGCDDGGQLPLDWCGADCQPQRLDVEPLEGNETFDEAQSLDRFQLVRFHAEVDHDEVDIYTMALEAGQTLTLTKGERSCRDNAAMVYAPDGSELREPWDCADMAETVTFTADEPGDYYLRFETSADGARSITAQLQ